MSKREIFMIWKDSGDDDKFLNTKLRTHLEENGIDYRTGYSACSSCGIVDEWWCTSIDTNDFKRAMRRFPLDICSGEQEDPDDDSEYYWDCSRKQYRCSVCNGLGHNKRTCKMVNKDK